MPGVHRKGDSTCGHGCPPGGPCGFAPPTVPATYSPNVFANGRNVVRKGDSIVPHPCLNCEEDCTLPCPPHSGTYIGTHTVYTNGRDTQVCGDPITCTDSVCSCSGNVIVE